MIQYEIQQRLNPRWFPWVLVNEWEHLSLHLTEENANIRKLAHESRSTAYVYRVVPIIQKD